MQRNADQEHAKYNEIQKKADQGDFVAKAKLAEMFEHGKGVGVDLIAARKYYQEASEGGQLVQKDIERLNGNDNIKFFDDIKKIFPNKIASANLDGNGELAITFSDKGTYDKAKTLFPDQMNGDNKNWLLIEITDELKKRLANDAEFQRMKAIVDQKPEVPNQPAPKARIIRDKLHERLKQKLQSGANTQDAAPTQQTQLATPAPTPASQAPASPAASQALAATTSIQPNAPTASADRSPSFLSDDFLKKIRKSVEPWTVEKVPSSPPNKNIYHVLNQTREPQFEIHPNRLVACNLKKETFVAMLKAYKATYGDLLPKITTPDTLKGTWKEVFAEVYPGKQVNFDEIFQLPTPANQAAPRPAAPANPPASPQQTAAPASDPPKPAPRATEPLKPVPPTTESPRRRL